MIYTHPGSGAETQLLTIAEKRRNTPTALADALDWLDDPKARFLVNSRSGRAAVQVSATSLMLDDGTIEPRLRLIRPTEASTVPARMMDDTHWLEADRPAFAAAWTAELAEVPEFSEATLHIVAGLLLPIWKQLPQDETRVYRSDPRTTEPIRLSHIPSVHGHPQSQSSDQHSGQSFARLRGVARSW